MSSSTSPSDHILELYYAEVRDSRLLSAEEERELFQRYRNCSGCSHAYGLKDGAATCPQCRAPRDFKARNILIQGAMRYALKEAKKYAIKAKGHRHDTDILRNLISAANLALLVAVDRFDTSRSNRFLTYAAWWVQEKIKEELDHMGLVHVPVYKQKDLRRRRKAGESTEDALGHVRVEGLGDVDHHQCDNSLEEALINCYGSELIYKALEDLDIRGRDKYAVLAYFVVKEEARSMKQIALRLDLSIESIRQIKNRVMAQLKEHLDDNEISGASDVFSE